MLIDRSEIAKRIPHAGGMCLLDGVIQWDATTICCVSASHRDECNPLRSRGRLHAVCGVEYAAQAMALHGGLCGAVGRRPHTGYLASVRDLVCHVERLDGLPGELLVEAEKLLGDEQRVIYQFALKSGDKELLSGRAAVVLDVAQSGDAP
jgi:predicted hotdog family 3-hydroxylacyl-ACP dehydratase